MRNQTKWTFHNIILLSNLYPIKAVESMLGLDPILMAMNVNVGSVLLVEK